MSHAMYRHDGRPKHIHQGTWEGFCSARGLDARHRLVDPRPHGALRCLCDRLGILWCVSNSALCKQNARAPVKMGDVFYAAD